MKRREAKPFRLPGSYRIALGAALGALLAGACGGTVGSRAPIIGSESHFLAYCGDGCGPGLDCIGGICTRACLTDQASCGGPDANGACTNRNVTARYSADLVFTFPTNNYYQNQTFEISAP